MPNKRISDFSTVSDTSDLWLPAYNLTRTLGDQNVKISADAMAAAFRAGNTQNFYPVAQATPDGITVAPNGTTDYQLWTSQGSTTDVLVLSLQVKGNTIAAPVYNLEIFAGSPSAATPVRVYNSASVLNDYIGNDGLNDFALADLLYVPYAAAGTNELWVRISNQQNISMTVFAQIVAMEFPGTGILLPGYVAPPPYTGPLLSTVHVGANEQFAEPQYAMKALADGGTMYIDGGIYYLPFGITSNSTYANSDNYGPNNNSPYKAARFFEGVTIIGNGTYGTNPTVFNGRGGYGTNPSHPFRLTSGLGFCVTDAPLNISDIQFFYCGGDDQISDGEAGLYIRGAPIIDGVAQDMTVHVQRCAFDKNENGIFSQAWYSSTTESPANATGVGNTVTLTVEDCDFGYAFPNGGSGDAHAQDIYSECRTINVTNCNFYGDLTPLPWRQTLEVTGPYQAAGTDTSSGNELKSRGIFHNYSNCWFRSQSGKQIDFPGGGVARIDNCIFSTLPGTNALTIAYNTEFTTPNNTMADVVFSNCTFYATRNNMVWWNPTTNFDMTDNNVIKWVSAGATIVANRNNSGYIGDPTVVPGIGPADVDSTNHQLIPPANTTFVSNPAAPPLRSFAGDPSPFQPLNP